MAYTQRERNNFQQMTFWRRCCECSRRIRVPLIYKNSNHNRCEACAIKNYHNTKKVISS